MADVIAVAPELTAASAALLVERFGSRYTSPEAIAEAGIATASNGFRALDPAVAAEAGTLLDAAYRTLDPGGRTKVGAYLDHVRGGTVTPEESLEGRRIFTDALHRLPEARRARLASLYESAIAVGLKEYAAAEARTLEAQPVGRPLVATGGPGRVVGTPVAPTDWTMSDPSMARVLPKPRGLPTRGEAYWKAEAQRRKARVVALEQEQASLEAEGARLRQTPHYGPAQIGFGTPPPDPFIIAIDRIKRRTIQVNELIEQARKSVLDLEFDCVHDGGLPGWVR